jgi:hypothetical protein
VEQALQRVDADVTVAVAELGERDLRERDLRESRT